MIMHLFSLFPLKQKGKNLLEDLSHGVSSPRDTREMQMIEKGSLGHTLMFQWCLWKAANRKKQGIEHLPPSAALS